MKHLTPLLPSLLLLAAAGCVTDDRPANVIAASRLDGAAPGGEGGLIVSSWVDDGIGDRLRIDGMYVIGEMDDGWEYARFLGVGNGIGAWLPAGAHQIEIVDDDGNAVASAAVDVAADPSFGGFYSETFVWGPRGGATSWSFVPDVAPDPDVVTFDVRNAAAEPFVVERCIGSYDTPPCEPIATIPAGGEWNAALPLGPSTPDGVGEVYLQGRLEGSPIASWSGSTRPEACRQQGFYLPAEIIQMRGPGATPDMRVVSAQPTCF